MNKIIDDAKVKYVMGEIDENGFKNAVDQWLKQGGEQIIQEYNEQYSQYN